MHIQHRFYKCIVAFTHFAGKPLKVTDHADALTDTHLDKIEEALQLVASSFRNENKEKWPELHKLADEIERALS